MGWGSVYNIGMNRFVLRLMKGWKDGSDIGARLRRNVELTFPNSSIIIKSISRQNK